MVLPNSFPPSMDHHTEFIHLSGRFDYTPSTFRLNAMEWHLNFAHPNLFAMYGEEPLRQDETQVLEHPVLSSIRELLVKEHQDHSFTQQYGRSTPVLLRNVQRTLDISVERNPAEGRPAGLYGPSQFVQASKEVLEKAVTRLGTPSISNIVAVSAPNVSAEFANASCYTRGHIEAALLAIFSAFTAVKAETVLQHADEGQCPSVVIHTGFWGTGGFGGNKVLLCLLQLVAAIAARVDVLVFHLFDAESGAAYSLAHEALAKLMERLIVPCKGRKRQALNGSVTRSASQDGFPASDSTLFSMLVQEPRTPFSPITPAFSPVTPVTPCSPDVTRTMCIRGQVEMSVLLNQIHSFGFHWQ